MKKKVLNYIAVNLAIASIFIALISGCSSHTKKKMTTLFFTGFTSSDLENNKQEIDANVLNDEHKIVTTFHSPFAKGLCTQCHIISIFHPSKGKALESAQNKKLLVYPTNQLCSKCHIIDISDKTFPEGVWIHAPSAQGACIVCHSPHESEHPRMLYDQPSVLCMRCHAQNGFFSESFGKEIRGHKEKRECIECHNPHIGKNPFMLKMDCTEVWLKPKKPWENQDVAINRR